MMIDVNTASQQELIALKGVSSEIADAIIRTMPY